MSWEGYYQVLCKNGHLSCVDGYAYAGYGLDDDDDEAYLCPVCGDGAVWHYCVDQTNTAGHAYDKFVEIETAKTETCLTCGHVRTISEARYRVPTKEEIEQFHKKIEEEDHDS